MKLQTAIENAEVAGVDAAHEELRGAHDAPAAPGAATLVAHPPAGAVLAGAATDGARGACWSGVGGACWWVVAHRRRRPAALYA